MTDASPATDEDVTRLRGKTNPCGSVSPHQIDRLIARIDADRAENERLKSVQARLVHGFDKQCARVKALTTELRKYGLVEHHRMTFGGKSYVSGYSCKLCECEWVEPGRENHDPSCLLHGTSPVPPLTGDGYG